MAALRLGLIRLGVAVGRADRRASIDDTRKYMWTGLISQAGITLGFAAVVAREFRELGR